MLILSLPLNSIFGNGIGIKGTETYSKGTPNVSGPQYTPIPNNIKIANFMIRLIAKIQPKKMIVQLTNNPKLSLQTPYNPSNKKLRFKSNGHKPLPSTNFHTYKQTYTTV